MIINKETNEKHWDGAKNRAIRWYFYQQRGLALFNELRYLLLCIFGLYMFMKLDNPVWLLIMFFVSCPVLVFVGWLQVHHMARVIDWLGVEFATFWSRYSFELQERQTKALEDMNEKIK
jgi:hypothetical protein